MENKSGAKKGKKIRINVFRTRIVVLYLGENALSDNLLDNQWHGDN